MSKERRTQLVRRAVYIVLALLVIYLAVVGLIALLANAFPGE